MSAAVPRALAAAVAAVATGSGVVLPAAAAGTLEIGGFVGGEAATHSGSFVQPTDVAVYEGTAETGEDDKILVAEGSRVLDRVQRLDADGNFERAWGDGELDRPSALAVSPENGDVYVLDAGNRRVSQYDIDGRSLRSWSLTIGGATGGYARAAIAVSPTDDHDVFVADEAHDRVLQFDDEGEFQRAWGLGVATGARQFEVCTEEDDCRPGLRVVTGAGPPASWPNHIAVDGDGVVYGSTFFGNVFRDRPPARVRIVRFRSGSPPDGPEADEALLRPLTPNALSPSRPETPEASLTDGATLGLDVDQASGRLIAINNPFGPSRLDLVSNPGADVDAEERPSTTVVETLPFLQNVNGIAVTDRGDAILLASGVLRQLAGTSTYTGCAHDDAERDCHGLIVLTPGGLPGAVATPPLSGSAPAALIDPHGAARYRFQVSSDGRSWRDLGDSRYVIGSEYEYVTASTGGLTPGTLYRVRLDIERRADAETERLEREVGFFLTPA